MFQLEKTDEEVSNRSIQTQFNSLYPRNIYII